MRPSPEPQAEEGSSLYLILDSFLSLFRLHPFDKSPLRYHFATWMGAAPSFMGDSGSSPNNFTVSTAPKARQILSVFFFLQLQTGFWGRGNLLLLFFFGCLRGSKDNYSVSYCSYSKRHGHQRQTTSGATEPFLPFSIPTRFCS